VIKNKRNRINANFRQLVREQGDRIYNLALMKCGQVTLAEDICQETFMRVYKGLENFRSESQLNTWVYRIALNVCHTTIAKEVRREQHVILSPVGKEFEVLDESSNVQDLFIEQSRNQMIREAIAGLPGSQSDAITLYYLQEFQYTEVAEIMDIPINTLKSHLRRAKQKLSEMIKEVEL